MATSIRTEKQHCHQAAASVRPSANTAGQYALFCFCHHGQLPRPAGFKFVGAKPFRKSLAGAIPITPTSLRCFNLSMRSPCCLPAVSLTSLDTKAGFAGHNYLVGRCGYACLFHPDRERHFPPFLAGLALRPFPFPSWDLWFPGPCLAIGESGNFPAAIKATAEYFPKKERSLATGIFNSGSNVGAILAPLTVPWIALHWGWQTAFLLIGIIGFLWMLFWIWLYNKPANQKRLSRRVNSNTSTATTWIWQK